MSWTAGLDSAWSKSTVRGWFMNNLRVFGPSFSGALNLIEWILTAWLNVTDKINCSSQSDCKKPPPLVKACANGWSSASFKHSHWFFVMNTFRSICFDTNRIQSSREISVINDFENHIAMKRTRPWPKSSPASASPLPMCCWIFASKPARSAPWRRSIFVCKNYWINYRFYKDFHFIIRFIYLVPIEEKRWHRAYTLGRRCILTFININFQEHRPWIFVGQLLKMWRDSLAWATPFQ